MRKEVIVHQDPKSPISEIFRTLRTNIQFMNTKGKLRTILVTSTLPGEGKSWVSSNLAVTFAQAGRKVIIIDADMRKGRQYSIFGLSPTPGLSNYLSGMDSEYNEVETDNLSNFIQETGIENLSIISAGNVPPNPSELLIMPKMEELLEKLKDIFDIIIIDGTPSQLVTDSLILTRLVDSTLIVTASKQTKKEDLKKVIRNIKNVGGKIAGVVVNKIEVSVKKYDQTYYYGSTAMTTKRISKKKNKNNREIYQRTASMIEPRNRNEEAESDNVENTKNDIFEQTAVEEKIENIKEESETLENKIKVENTEEITLEKTTDILNQINQYLDEEKKKLK